MARLNVSSIVAPAVEPVRLNVADRLGHSAAAMPRAIAVACPRRSSRGCPTKRFGDSGAIYSTTTFAELDADATQIAHGLSAWGMPPGTRLALLVRPGIKFVMLVFALLRAGMVIVLVDPGLGRRNLVRCLTEAEPEGFVAIPAAQAARVWLRRRFPRARWNVTVGRRWFWSGMTLNQLRRVGSTANPLHAPCSPLPASVPAPRSVLPATSADDPAAIIFTSGSTGPPKGVLYTHRMFDTQVAEIQSMYGIEPGGVDLACFPLFALFNAAMGVTTVLPEMDFSRPASADPKKLLAAANDWQVTQAFATPAVWRVLSDYCAQSGQRIESLRQVFSCGAPVPARVIQTTLEWVAPAAKLHTPYGATECLPVATIEAADVLGETAARTDEGAGVCVGRKFDSIDWRMIRITDQPIATLDGAEELPPGEIGELIVRGPQASPCYVTGNDEFRMTNDEKPESHSSFVIGHSSFSNALAKIRNGNTSWHRMGDVGYLDEQGRFWYCGRKSQRVETANGPLFTECVEAIFNTHPAVRRSALVGVGPRDHLTPVIVIERESTHSVNDLERELLQLGKKSSQTRTIRHVLFHPQLPVDVRHNAKINRDQLASWAAKRLGTHHSQLTPDT